jgi:hypothetical protein
LTADALYRYCRGAPWCYLAEQTANGKWFDACTVGAPVDACARNLVTVAKFSSNSTWPVFTDSDKGMYIKLHLDEDYMTEGGLTLELRYAESCKTAGCGEHGSCTQHQVSAARMHIHAAGVSLVLTKCDGALRLAGGAERSELLALVLEQGRRAGECGQRGSVRNVERQPKCHDRQHVGFVHLRLQLRMGRCRLHGAASSGITLPGHWCALNLCTGCGFTWGWGSR